MKNCTRPGCGGRIVTDDDGVYVVMRCLLCGRGEEWEKIIVPREPVPISVEGASLIERLMAPPPPPPVPDVNVERDPVVAAKLDWFDSLIRIARERHDRWEEIEVVSQRADYLEQAQRKARADQRARERDARRQWAEYRRSHNSYHGGAHSYAVRTYAKFRDQTTQRQNLSFDNIVAAYEEVDR